MDEIPTLEGAGTRALKMIGSAILVIIGIAIAAWWHFRGPGTNRPGGSDCQDSHQCASNACTRGTCDRVNTYGDSARGYPCSFDTDCQSKRCSAQRCE